MSIKQVLQILASLAALIGVAPAFSFLDLFTQLASVIALIFGTLADRRERGHLSTLLATLLTLACFGFDLPQMSRANMVDPLINLLVFLLAIRLLTAKSGRNLLQIFVLSTFVLAASSLLSLSMGYLLCLILLIGLVTFGLLLTSFYSSSPQQCLTARQWKSLIATGSIMPLVSVLLIPLFFTLLPRTEYPLWNFLNPPLKASSGFSEEVSPGSFSNLEQTRNPVFRVEMAETDPQQLYWPARNLNQTNGQRWTRDNAPPLDIKLGPVGTLRELTIYSEPRSDRYLPSLERPLGMSNLKAQRLPDNIFVTGTNLAQRHQYKIRVVPEMRIGLKDDAQRTFYLQSPKLESPRMQQLISGLKAKENAAAKVQATIEFFLRQKLSYSGQKLPLTTSPIETFLFESKRGYCEYFASSFATLLRLAGVPTRLVGGYLGGRYNQIGGYYLIDESMAHVWVEALADDNHWQRIDPSRLAINAQEAVNGLAQKPLGITQSLSDYLKTSWTKLVITYDLHQQLRLLFTTGNRLRTLKPELKARNLAWLTLPLLPWLLIRLRRYWRLRPNKQQRLLARYQRTLCRCCQLKTLPKNLGLFALAEQTQEPLCREFAQIYGAIIYGDALLSREKERQLQTIIRQLSQRRISWPPQTIGKD